MPPPAHAELLPSLDPVDVFGRLIHQPGVFWLDSSLRRPADGRYSIMGCAPREVFSTRGDAWQIQRAAGGREQGDVRSLERMEQWLSQNRVGPAAQNGRLPFVGGAVGWLAYDLGRQFELLPAKAGDDPAVPDIRLAWFDGAIVWDHLEAKTWLVAQAGERSVDQITTELRGLLAHPAGDLAAKIAPPPCVARSNLSRDNYMARVESIRQGIARGEYYQLNLVQRFTCPHLEPPGATYLRLRSINPAPFSAFLATDDGAVLSSSPERFLEVTSDGAARTCPIKGTRPRSAAPAEDELRRHELLGSEKERAELLMIVDLLRNDLGRVCTPGSITVPRLHSLESFATVHHLVGEVRGRLRAGVTRGDLLRATFPGGSITGAPKVSAMRAIEQFEPHRRGISMGSIGYFSAHGRCDLNIAIRTIVTRARTAHISVGAGIVWDSQPAAEYAETLAKARALFQALNVTGIEP